MFVLNQTDWKNDTYDFLSSIIRRHFCLYIIFFICVVGAFCFVVGFFFLPTVPLLDLWFSGKKAIKLDFSSICEKEKRLLLTLLLKIFVCDRNSTSLSFPLVFTSSTCGTKEQRFLQSSTSSFIWDSAKTKIQLIDPRIWISSIAALII